mmetsp:Transcript_26091/g.52407  ORF Transcript_26091/g.52407 Transcript_26091/m.52407 type:complete len:82 (+) Transcript_26091:1258-1503(+)
MYQYQYWHCDGNQLQICSMKYFHSSDVSFLGDSTLIRLNEVKQLMEAIDQQQIELGKANEEDEHVECEHLLPLTVRKLTSI